MDNQETEELNRVIPYLPSNIDHPQPLVDEIRQRRGGELLHLDRILLHSPPLAQGWNAMLGQIRSNLLVPMKLRELIMCSIAMLNAAEYEFYQHAPVYISAGGREEELAILRGRLQALTTTTTSQSTVTTSPQDTTVDRYIEFDRSIFSEIEEMVISLTLQMTRYIHVDQRLIRKLDAILGHQQVVELVGVISAYNMVSRFLVALDISHHDSDDDVQNH
jgi:alkylhydroperoxidase family enzyme